MISLDFELHWGVRDRPDCRTYLPNLLGARKAIPQLLDLFEEFGVAATWATVGFLFAECRRELIEHFPRERARYSNQALCPYQEIIGEDEADDPLHYAPTLISEIARRPRQEIGTHTFSHYYALEEGRSRETFDADLRQAVLLAAKRGIIVRSIVFPRNQVNPEYLDLLPKHGIHAYRGSESGWMYSARNRAAEQTYRRAARLIDQYWSLVSKKTISWAEICDRSGLANVRGSMFLRPYSAKLAMLDLQRRHRICAGLTEAAVQRRIFHLWWHPHNFGRNTAENLLFLRSILEHFNALREEYNMRSLSMADVARETGVFDQPCTLVEAKR